MTLKEKIEIPKYTLAEELISAISHGIGALLSIAGLVLLMSFFHLINILLLFNVFVNKKEDFYIFLHYFNFIVGKSITSLIVSEFVSNITSLSIPIPIPPVGGIPYSRAST